MNWEKHCFWKKLLPGFYLWLVFGFRRKPQPQEVKPKARCEHTCDMTTAFVGSSIQSGEISSRQWIISCFVAPSAHHQWQSAKVCCGSGRLSCWDSDGSEMHGEEEEDRRRGRTLTTRTGPPFRLLSST
jgi:hypothetical protein